MANEMVTQLAEWLGFEMDMVKVQWLVHLLAYKKDFPMEMGMGADSGAVLGYELAGYLVWPMALRLGVMRGNGWASEKVMKTDYELDHVLVLSLDHELAYVLVLWLDYELVHVLGLLMVYELVHVSALH